MPVVKYIDLIKVIIFTIIIVYSRIYGQPSSVVAPKQNPNPVQVTVSGNHPDAIENRSTVIFDNTKNVDLRSYERPIKNTIPSSDTEEELFLPNEVIPILDIEEIDLYSLPETDPISEELNKKEIKDDIVSIASSENNTEYIGTRKQNILLMKSLGIRSGWSNNEKWPDGTDIDDYSIVDWIKSGKGESMGVTKDASIESRKNLFYKYYISVQ